jgi:cytochrome c-type biogenesis protein CcmE
MLKTPLDTINPSFKLSFSVENIPESVLIERNRILPNLLKPLQDIMATSILSTTNNILII